MREVMGALVRSAASQMQINESHAQMHSLNFFFNYCNSARSRQLQEEYAMVKQDIREGQAMLVKMQQQSAIQTEAIASLTHSVDVITEGVEQQKGRLDNLTQTVDEQKEAVARALDDYNKKLMHQQSMIKEQEQILQRLLSVRFRVDFGIDVGIALLAWWLTSSRLLNFFLRNSAGMLAGGGSGPRGNERAMVLVKTVRLFIFFGLVKQLRQKAIDNGLHNLVGSYSKYTNYMFGSLGSVVSVVGDRVTGDTHGTRAVELVSDLSHSVAARVSDLVNYWWGNDLPHAQTEQSAREGETNQTANVTTSSTNGNGTLANGTATTADATSPAADSAHATSITGPAALSKNETAAAAAASSLLSQRNEEPETLSTVPSKPISALASSLSTPRASLSASTSSIASAEPVSTGPRVTFADSVQVAVATESAPQKPHQQSQQQRSRAGHSRTASVGSNGALSASVGELPSQTAGNSERATPPKPKHSRSVSTFSSPARSQELPPANGTKRSAPVSLNSPLSAPAAAAVAAGAGAPPLLRSVSAQQSPPRPMLHKRSQTMRPPMTRPPLQAAADFEVLRTAAQSAALNGGHRPTNSNAAAAAASKPILVRGKSVQLPSTNSVDSGLRGQ